MIDIFKNRYVFMLSSLIASGASYFLNVTLIFLLEDKSQYADYLSINSWAIYFSTFFYLSIIELYVSPEGKSFEISSLLNSSFFTLISCSVFFIFLYFFVGYNYISFSVLFTAIFYALIKLITQYFIFSSKTEGVVLLRYGRSLLIGFSILILYLLKENYGVILDAKGQLYVQGIICCFISIIVVFFFNIKFTFNKTEVSDVLYIFRYRIAKRNFSMLFDMIHMPIMYYIISDNSQFLNSSFVYTLGLVLPMAYVISVILKEQLMIKIDSNGFNLATNISKWMLFVVTLSYISISILYVQGEGYQIFSLLLLGTLISFSGCIGLNIYRKGLEKYDLITNIVVMLLLLSVFWLGIIESPQNQVFLSVIFVSLKFTVQILLSLFGKEEVGDF